MQDLQAQIDALTESLICQQQQIIAVTEYARAMRDLIIDAGLVSADDVDGALQSRVSAVKSSKYSSISDPTYPAKVAAYLDVMIRRTTERAAQPNLTVIAGGRDDDPEGN